MVVPAKRFMFPPYSFAANYYLPEKKRRAGRGEGGSEEALAACR